MLRHQKKINFWFDMTDMILTKICLSIRICPVLDPVTLDTLTGPLDLSADRHAGSVLPSTLPDHLNTNAKTYSD